jgi:hypothetical protein
MDFQIGDYIKFTAATTPGPTTTSYTAASFTTNIFEVLTVPNANTFTITMPTAETGTGVTTGGTLTVAPYMLILVHTAQTYWLWLGNCRHGVLMQVVLGWGEASSCISTVVLITRTTGHLIILDKY